ncbi:hypothetical protein CYMTET_28384, partial [Cymbomonas tetramitiformis]
MSGRARTRLRHGERGGVRNIYALGKATGGAVIIEYGFMEVRSSTFNKNQAQGGGGAIAVTRKSSLFLHQDVLFEQNTAGSTGGALYCAISSMVRFFTLSVLLANSASQ